ncbi:MAG TPA: hypothetical protein PK876_00240 [Elusimicrobiota bacterium]|nr:hypothetical protein [Elusimicrobiota bacterium]
MSIPGLGTAGAGRNPALIHGACLLFLVVYAVLLQFEYAVSDRQIVIDHDHGILQNSRMYVHYNDDPVGYIRQSLKGLLIHQGDIWHKKSLSTLILAIGFFVFGKTIFVYKMCMVWAFLGLGLASYYLVRRQTGIEWIGLVGGLLVMTAPIIPSMARTHYGYLPLACLMVWSFHVYLIYQERRQKTCLAVLCLLSYVATWTHYSVYLYLFLLGLIWLAMTDDRRRAVGYLCFVFLLMLWNPDQINLWVDQLYRIYWSVPALVHPVTLWADPARVEWRTILDYPGIILRILGILKWSMGTDLYYLLIAALLVYEKYQKKMFPLGSEREWSAVRLLRLFFFGVLLVVLATVVGYVAGYILLPVSGILLLVLMAKKIMDLPASSARVYGAVFLIALGAVHTLNPFAGKDPFKRWVMDLGQFMHYVRQEGGSDPVPTLRTAYMMDSQGHLKYFKFFNFRYSLNCYIDAQAFYHDALLTADHFDIHPLDRTMADYLKADERMTWSSHSYRYLFVLITLENPQEPDPPVSTEHIVKEMKEVLGPSVYEKICDPFRFLVRYQISEDSYLFVFKSKTLLARQV